MFSIHVQVPLGPGERLSGIERMLTSAATFYQHFNRKSKFLKSQYVLIPRFKKAG